MQPDQKVIDTSPRIQYHKPTSRSGEIGRHATFRALCSQGHGGSSPPFGTQSIYCEPLYTSSKARSRLRCFHCPLCTATVLHSIDQRKKVSGAMLNRIPGASVLWSHTYLRRTAATKDHPFSPDCLCEVDQWRTTATRKAGFSLGYFEHVLRALSELK